MDNVFQHKINALKPIIAWVVHKLVPLLRIIVILPDNVYKVNQIACKLKMGVLLIIQGSVLIQDYALKHHLLAILLTNLTQIMPLVVHNPSVSKVVL